MNIGIIGVGTWGTLLLHRFENIATVTRCANKHDVSWLREFHPNIKATLDYHDILLDPNIDAVVISVPHNELYPIAKDALMSGKHVFIEKPMAESLDQAQELMRHKKKDQVLFVGYTFMYSPIYDELKRIDKEDPIIRLDMNWTKFGTFGNDILLNLASHDIAMAVDLMGGNTPEIIEMKGKDKDVVSIRLEFEGGRDAKININRKYPVEQKIISIITLSGRRFYWVDKQLFEIKADGLFLSDLAYTENLLKECKTFLRCIEYKTKPITDDILACKVLDIIDRLKQAPEPIIDRGRKYIISEYRLGYGLPTVDLFDLFPDFEETINPYSFLDGSSSPIDIGVLKAFSRWYENCNYLEIGTWRGESVANVAQIADKCTTLDLSDVELDLNMRTNAFRSNIGFFSKGCKNIRHVDSSTFDISSTEERFNLIFIDGDHSYDAVLRDTQGAFKLLKNDRSVIIWHDYGSSLKSIRWPVLAGILDGCPIEKRKDLYHISNTLCAAYINDLALDTTRMKTHDVPNKSFEVKIKKSGEFTRPI